MNREIKFRAWLPQYKQMITELFGLRSDGETSFNTEAILMQFTRLHDKNGVEIYEGDILKWKCSKSGDKKEMFYTVVIEWGGDMAHSYSLTIYDKGEKWGTSKSYWNANDREVIGNIHQNSNFLK